MEADAVRLYELETRMAKGDATAVEELREFIASLPTERLRAVRMAFADRSMTEVTVGLSDVVMRRLAVLHPPGLGAADLRAHVAGVLVALADHAQQGVYRPGAWERDWLIQAFGDGWLDEVEPDTDDTAADGRVIFDRPRGEV
jgi:hypothetical protein